MTLEDLGYNEVLEQYRIENNLESFQIGRVISEHKDRYIVKTISGDYNSELLGNLRYAAESRSDLPAVGDWVAISEYDEDKALIHAIYPRHSVIERKAVGKQSDKQIIATNIDVALIVQAVNRDFNINRIERYLTICNTSKIEPIIILSKIDLIDEAKINQLLKDIKDRLKDVTLIALSNFTQSGLDQIKKIITKGKTYCLLGSSGVGKSTLINNLAEEEIMVTGSINESIDRGKHVTTHRELIPLKNGGIFIDNPGMREVGIADSTDGLQMTFEAIYEFAKNCRYKDCTHTQENDCAVIEALELGEIDEASYANFRKMEKEKSHFESDALEKRRKDKSFGKMIKNIQKERRNRKF